jgi:RES domain-containing protein
MALDVDPTSVRGVWVRHVPARARPLFRPRTPGDGRWQRGEVVEGFYLAKDEATVWAEWYRSLAERSIPPLRQLPRDLWRFDVTIKRVADLSSPERLERVGLPTPTPDRRQWPTFQKVGESLFAEGWPAVLYPPAARPQSRALCIFRKGTRVAGVKTRGRPKRFTEPPVPPRGLRT